MEVLIVEFGLTGLTEAEYYHGADRDAPAFAGIPGLITKVWTADPANNRYGGVYLFRDAASLEDYTASDLFRALKETPEFKDMKVSRHTVLDGPTRITHGGVLQAA